MSESASCTQSVPLSNLAPKPVPAPNDLPIVKEANAPRKDSVEFGAFARVADKWPAKLLSVGTSVIHGASVREIHQAGLKQATETIPHASTSGLGRAHLRSDSTQIAHRATSETATSAARKETKQARGVAAATWLGVAVAIAALSIAIYYGVLMLKLAKWTALKDFREACIEDEARGNPSRHCNETLLKPLQPPPITKRTLHVLANGLTNEWLKVLITTYACVVTAILVAVHFKPYDFLRRKPVISLARKTPRILNDSISEASHSFDSSKLLDGQKKHPNRSAIKGWPAQVSKVYKEIIDLQDGALGAHITLCQSKELVKLKLQHMRESLSEVRLLLSSTSDSSSSSSSSKARDAWRTKCDQFSTDGVALEHHLHALDTQEAKLMLLLYTLAKKQPDLLRTLDDYFRIRREVQDTVFGASAPSSTIEPLLQEYYDKRGNMSILREQLQDLRLDIEEESCAVEHFGREESLRKNSLPELWQKYQARLKKLQAAPFELKQTWLACQDAGLDVGGLGPEVALAPDEFSAPLSLSAQPFVPSS